MENRFVNFTMKILLFKIGAIGDVLMTTPLIRQLRKNFPDAKIDYLVGDYSKVILKRNKYLDKILTFDSMIFVKKKIFKWIKLIRSVRKRRYDVIFVLDKHWIFNLTAFLFGIKRRIGFDRLGKEGIFLTDKIYYGPVRHEIFYYLDLLKAFGGKTNYKDWKMDLFLSKEDEEFADKIWRKYKLKGKKVVGVAPGGGKNPGQFLSIKIWPWQNYSKLIEKLIEMGKYIILVGGDDDKEIAKKIMNKTNQTKKAINLIGNTSIKQSAAIIKKCCYFICNDSGAMHIAASVNDRIISLFGPTDPRRLAPLYNSSNHIWKEKKACYDIFGNSKECKGDEIKKIKTEDVIKKQKKLGNV